MISQYIERGKASFAMSANEKMEECVFQIPIYSKHDQGKVN